MLFSKRVKISKEINVSNNFAKFSLQYIDVYIMETAF